MNCIGIISIEGIVGAGKSTVYDIIKSTPNDVQKFFCDEPVEDWTEILQVTELQRSIYERQGEEIKPTSALETMYEEGIRKKNKQIIVAFQFYALISRAQALRRTISEAEKTGLPYIIVGERLGPSDEEVFVATAIESGLICPEAAAMLVKVRKEVMKEMQDMIKVLITVEAEVETCQKRTQLRGRKGEKDISLDYLQLLKDKHEDMYTKMEGEGVKTYKLCWNQESIFQEDKKRIMFLEGKITKFLFWGK